MKKKSYPTDIIKMFRKIDDAMNDVMSGKWDDVPDLGREEQSIKASFHIMQGSCICWYLLLFFLFIISLSRAWNVVDLKFPSIKKRGATMIAVAATAIQVSATELKPVFAASSSITHSSTMRSMFLVSRNLPEHTGASQGNQGQMTTLLPIINMQAALEKALLATSTGNLQEIKNNLDIIPSREKDFKRLFDEYSEGVSYKQQYLDKNAFLV